MTLASSLLDDTSAVIFDFDFTLADSSVGIIACIRYALDRMELPPQSDARILDTVGLYLPEALVALFGEQYRPRGMEFMDLFTEKADEVMSDGTFLYPYAPRALNAIRKYGHKLGIVSTKYRYRIEAILERDGLASCIDVIIGGEDVTKHKPSPEGLLIAAERLGVAIDECLYIGDSEVDAKASASADMRFVAVTTGTTPAATFEKYPRIAVISDLSNLVLDLR